MWTACLEIEEAEPPGFASLVFNGRCDSEPEAIMHSSARKPSALSLLENSHCGVRREHYDQWPTIRLNSNRQTHFLRGHPSLRQGCHGGLKPLGLNC